MYAKIPKLENDLPKYRMLVLCEKFIFYLDKNCNVGVFIKMSLNLTEKIGSKEYRTSVIFANPKVILDNTGCYQW